MKMPGPLFFAAISLASMPGLTQIFPEAPPANRSASGSNSLRNLALGEPRFTNAQLYNLYDQGGSPLGLLETHPERVSAGFEILGTSRSTDGDSLAIDHTDYAIPQLGFFKPGIVGATLYYQRQAETYQAKGGDSVETGTSLFGVDLVAGPASGLLRVGLAVHVAIGNMDYSGDMNRVILAIPALRFDIGSQLLPYLEVDAFAGFGGRFDSLQTPSGRLERVATLTLPRYGLLADFGGTQSLPLISDVVLELGTERFFGAYRQAGGASAEYPIVWTDYWTLQTQWMYTLKVREFKLAPALRFAHRSEDAQGYAAIKGNQNPFKKGNKINAMHETRDINAFGLGGSFSFREMSTLLLEWETSGHSYDVDSIQDERYHRFSLGVEQQVERLPWFRFPDNMSLALRAGWTWRQDAKSVPGYREFHFDPFLPSPRVPTRSVQLNPKPDDPAAYSAFSLGFGLGLLKEALGIEGLLSFPSQLERFGATRTQDASGTEFGITVCYRVL